MATSSVLARVGLVSAVAVILGISTLSPLLKPASDFGRVPMVNGPPLYQTTAMPLPAERTAAAAPATDARAKPVRLTSTAVALLALPQQKPAAERPVAPASVTTAVAPPPSPLQQQPPQQAQPVQAAASAAADPDALQPPPLVAESESPPKPEKRAAAPKKTKKARTQQPPVYTRAVQMHIY